MAHHSITVRNVNSGGSDGSGRAPKSTNKKYKKTSVKEHWVMKQKRGFTEGKNELKNLGYFKLAASLAVATAVASKGVSIYSNFMEAKSGEKMNYHNLRQGMRAFSNPAGFFKTAAWDYGVIAPMQISRQNEMLNYNRQLTGSLIHSKIYEGR